MVEYRKRATYRGHKDIGGTMAVTKWKIGQRVRVVRSGSILRVGATGRIADIHGVAGRGGQALIYLKGDAGAAWVPLSKLALVKGGKA